MPYCSSCGNYTYFYVAERIRLVEENKRKVSKIDWKVALCRPCVERTAGPRIANSVSLRFHYR